VEPAVDQAIRNELARLRAGPSDVAISSAACGSDILFLEAALERSAPARVYLPFAEDTFVEKSVAFAGEPWIARFRRVVARASCHVATHLLGPLRDGEDPYDRTNLWMLDEARRIGGAKLVFLSVWNGEGGDGPGGTKHMIDAVRAQGGEAVWIDIRKL
jgi:hypothetical protein